MNPKVSIIIPVYNGTNYMHEAIASALNQSYDHIEIIVVNDGSADNGATEKAALSYGDKIRYLKQENMGTAGALNTGIKHMQGDYFSWLSHDDLYLPEKIRLEVELLQALKNPKAIIYSHWMLMDASGKPLKTVQVKDMQPQLMLLYLLTDSKIHGCTLLIPRQAFDRAGLFNPDLKTVQDYDMWFRLCRAFPFYLCDNVLVKSRQHDEQSSKHILDPKSRYFDREELYLTNIKYVTPRYMKSVLPTQMWPKQLFNGTLFFMNKNMHRALLAWIQLAADLGRDEADIFRERLLAATLFPLMKHEYAHRFIDYIESNRL